MIVDSEEFMATKLTSFHRENDEDSRDVLDSAFSYLELAVQNRCVVPPTAAIRAEQEICIETRSLLVAFTGYVVDHGFEPDLATVVSGKLNEALHVLTADRLCQRSVQQRIEVDFQRLLAKARTNAADLAFLNY
jgi:hypothetical protein